jgi:hypothetical protein
VFVEISHFLEEDDIQLATLDFEKKRAYLGFFQELSLIMDAGLMREGITYYMFGYYAIRCFESQNFWKGVQRQSLYWGVFTHFANKMLEIDKKFINASPSDNKALSQYIKKNFRL